MKFLCTPELMKALESKVLSASFLYIYVSYVRLPLCAG